jgi:hypothetical protein
VLQGVDDHFVVVFVFVVLVSLLDYVTYVLQKVATWYSHANSNEWASCVNERAQVVASALK